MPASTVTAYSKSLKDLGIAHEVLEHPESSNIHEVLSFLKLPLPASLPTLVMQADGTNVALLIRGGDKIDFKIAKKHLGARNLRMATAEEFTTATGVPVGAARVYLPGFRTIIDPRVLEQEWLVGGSGDFGCSIRYKTADLKKIPGCEVLEMTVVSSSAR